MNVDGKKAPNGAGTFEWKRGKLYARLPLPGRPRVLVPDEYKSETRRRDFVVGCLQQVKDDPVVRERLLGGHASSGQGVTNRQLAKAWTSGALHEQYGGMNGLRPLASAQINAWTLEKHVLKVKTRGPKDPEFGELLVSETTEKDCAVVMARHRGQRLKTLQKTYRRMHRLFDLAIFPCGHRPEGSNPVTRRLRPSADEEEKEFCFLYPAEVLALLKCKRIPIGRRILYALAVYTGLRKGSLYALRWRDVDFENGTLTALKTKSRRPRFFALDPSLVRLLELWYAHCGDPTDDTAVVRDVQCEPRKEALALRDDLKTAGVKRALLFSEEPNVEKLRFHDLRATFVTWARRADKTDAWIEERTGHQDPEMIGRYTRAARTLADLRYQPFPDVSAAVPELAKGRRVVPVLSPHASPKGRRRSEATPKNRKAPQRSNSAEPVGASGFEPPTPRPPV